MRITTTLAQGTLQHLHGTTDQVNGKLMLHPSSLSLGTSVSSQSSTGNQIASTWWQPVGKVQHTVHVPAHTLSTNIALHVHLGSR